MAVPRKTYPPFRTKNLVVVNTITNDPHNRHAHFLKRLNTPLHSIYQAMHLPPNAHKSPTCVTRSPEHGATEACHKQHQRRTQIARTGRHEPVRRATYRYARVGFWSLTACSGRLESGSEISEAEREGIRRKLECRFAGVGWDAGSVEIDACRALEGCALEASMYIFVIGYM
jgi:hypothetical protein